MNHNEVIAYLWTLGDFWLMARNLWCEARNQGRIGMQAVAQVGMNRVNAPFYPKTIKKVVLQKNQFSWTIPGNVKNPAVIRYPWLYDLPAWRVAKEVAREAMDRYLPDLGLDKALFYRNPRTATSGWFQQQIDSGLFIFIKRIKDHDFYKLREK